MTTTTAQAALLLSTVVFVALGCGEPSDYEEESLPELASERVRAPAPHKPTAIELKLVSLPDEVAAGYYDRPLEAGEGLDTQGSPYRFYSGPLGLGALYVVDGTAIAIKGPILDEWARSGYENAALMGYPRGDEVDGRQEFERQWVVPEIENNGLSEKRHFLVYDGVAVHHVVENWYLDSNLPDGQLSSQPQQCYVRVASPLQGSALELLLDDPKYGGVIPSLWCGAEPGPWVPPQNSEWGDI